MKYINTINEFTRTIGFRYSKPSIKYKATLFCSGELTEDSLKELLNYIQVPFENVKISNEETTIDISGHEDKFGLANSGDDNIIETNLIVEFEFFVYSEQEIEKIVEEIRLGLNREFEVMTFDFLVKQSPMLKK